MVVGGVVQRRLLNVEGSAKSSMLRASHEQVYGH